MDGWDDVVDSAFSMRSLSLSNFSPSSPLVSAPEAAAAVLGLDDEDCLLVSAETNRSLIITCHNKQNFGNLVQFTSSVTRGNVFLLK